MTVSVRSASPGRVWGLPGLPLPVPPVLPVPGLPLLPGAAATTLRRSFFVRVSLPLVPLITGLNDPAGVPAAVWTVRTALVLVLARTLAPRRPRGSVRPSESFQLAVAPDGRPLTVRLTAPLNLCRRSILTEKVVALPCSAVRADGEADSVKVGLALAAYTSAPPPRTATTPSSVRASFALALFAVVWMRVEITGVGSERGEGRGSERGGPREADRPSRVGVLLLSRPS